MCGGKGPEKGGWCKFIMQNLTEGWLLTRLHRGSHVEKVKTKNNQTIKLQQAVTQTGGEQL